MAIHAHFCEAIGSQIGVIYRFAFGLFCGCAANFCKSVMNAFQEPGTDMSVNSEPVVNRYRAGYKTAFHPGCFLARLHAHKTAQDNAHLCPFMPGYAVLWPRELRFAPWFHGIFLLSLALGE